MGGTIYVMEQSDFDNWLSGNVSGQTPVQAGQDLFENKLGCASCHAGGANQRGAVLEGLFGSEVKLTNGQTVTANDEYIRNSILNPGGQIVEGYQPIMPTFKGQVTEEQLIQLVAYVKSLSGSKSGNSPASGSSANTANTSSGSGNMMRNNEANTNLVAPRTNRGDTNSQGSNPNAPKNQPETTNEENR
jgi:cytochrome c oxidase subunit 2